MILHDYANFFFASAGASGALIGLLFVAISVAPDRSEMLTASPLKRAAAASVFTALVNAFFISLSALIPDNNFGEKVIIFSLIGLSSTVFLIITLIQNIKHWLTAVRALLIVCAALAIYGFEALAGIGLVHTPQNRNLIGSITTLLLAVYGLGLVRAWELLGAQRYGLLSWLSPLADEPGAKE